MGKSSLSLMLVSCRRKHALVMQLNTGFGVGQENFFNAEKGTKVAALCQQGQLDKQQHTELQNSIYSPKLT